MVLTPFSIESRVLIMVCKALHHGNLSWLGSLLSCVLSGWGFVLVLTLTLFASSIWLNGSFPLKKNAFFIWLLKYIFSWFPADITGYVRSVCIASFFSYLPNVVYPGLVLECVLSSLLSPVPMTFNIISILMPVKFMTPASGSIFVHPTSILSLSSILFLGVQN